MIGAICVDVFNIEVGIFASDDDRRAFLKEQGCEAEEHTQSCFASAHVDIDDQGRRWFSMVIKPDATTATKAHECVHIADWIMETLGIPTGSENTEVRGYLVAHLLAGLMELEE